MAIGEHSVTVYADRAAGDWSDPLAANPYFTANQNGWEESPSTPSLVWSGGKIACIHMSRDDAYPVIRPAGATSYRVRTTFTTSRPCELWYGVSFGATAADAYEGPPGGADDVSTSLPVEPGTYTLTTTWSDLSSVDPLHGFVSPWIKADLYDGDATTRPLDVDSLVLDYLGGTGVDLSCVVGQVTINHGRDGATGQPEPASATFEISVTPDDPLPVDVEIGAVVTVTTAIDHTTSTRFVGRITDVSLGWDEAGELTPDSGIGQLVATSLLSDVGRRTVGDVPWTFELDGARVSRIMTDAGITLDPAWSDPGSMTILERDVDNQPALDLARSVADDAEGMLWHTRDGDIRYADAVHRRGAQPTLELDACDLLVTPTWNRTTDGLINDASIGYGWVAEGDQPRVTASNAPSITRFGLYGFTTTTQLKYAADAEARLSLLMIRNGSPVWVMASLPVDVEGLDDDQTTALLALDVHSLINLVGMPAIGTAPTSAFLWVEGWTETLAFDVHDLALVVSGFCRTAPAPRWDDVDPDYTWDNYGTGTWDDASCLGPTVDRGRWDDIAATLRWDLVDPAILWDTYSP